MRPAWKIRDWAQSAAEHGVHGVAIARKIVDDEASEEPCLQFFVEHKLPKRLIGRRALIPPRIDGIATDVVTLPRFRLSAGTVPTCPDARDRHRPIRPGVSAAHPDVGAGTLGCLCRSTDPNDPPGMVLALSNSHVFCTSPGNDAGVRLYQPALLDGAEPSDAFGRLHRFTTIRRRGNGTNNVDAAVGRLNAAVAGDNDVCSYGRLSGTGVAAAGTHVIKVGRSTKLTTGSILSTNADVDVYIPGRGAAIFEDQMLIAGDAGARFSDEGDSGALVIEADTRRAVGLLFASVDNGRHALANHLANVMAALSITLL